MSSRSEMKKEYNVEKDVKLASLTIVLASMLIIQTGCENIRKNNVYEIEKNNSEDDWNRIWFDVVKTNDLDKMKTLLKMDKGLIDIQNPEKDTALHIASEKGNEDIVRYLVKHGADVNIANNHGDISLHYAVNSGNENIVRYLVEHGADINKADVEKCTPVVIAAQGEYKNILKYLIEHGADLKNGIGSSLIWTLSFGGHEDIVKYLVEKCHVNINEINEREKTTLLTLASSLGEERLVKCFVKYGADVNQADGRGFAPLHLAAVSNSESIVKYLVEHGADVNAVDKKGFTPAAHINNKKILNYLKNKGITNSR